MLALADFLVGGGFVLRRGFRSVLRGSCLVDLSPDVTKAASLPAALPIVVAAFIRTPLVFLGAAFFFAIPLSFYEIKPCLRLKNQRTRCDSAEASSGAVGPKLDENLLPKSTPTYQAEIASPSQLEHFTKRFSEPFYRPVWWCWDDRGSLTDVYIVA